MFLVTFHHCAEVDFETTSYSSLLIFDVCRCCAADICWPNMHQVLSYKLNFITGSNPQIIQVKITFSKHYKTYVTHTVVGTIQIISSFNLIIKREGDLIADLNAKTEHSNIRKSDFRAEQLCWNTFDCTGERNKVATEWFHLGLNGSIL